MWNHAKLSLFLRISQIFCAFFWGWHDLKVYSCIRFQLQLHPPTLQRKNITLSPPFHPYGTKHHPGIHPPTKTRSVNDGHQVTTTFFYYKKPTKKITPNKKKTPSVLSKQKPWFNQPSTPPPPLFPNQPSTPLRAYLPINYFEPSKLLEACAAKQGTKVFPGQTLIDVVLKDGWVSVGKVGRWISPQSRVVGMDGVAF